MKDDTKVYVDGRLVDAGSAGVSVFDHGLLYGDGVFEGFACTTGARSLLKNT